MTELAALAGVALAHETLHDALAEICRISARIIPNADGATLTNYETSGPGVAAASSEWARSLDEMQYSEHEGPCIDAVRTGGMFRVRNILGEPRWPSYMPRAAELGAASMLSIPMTVESKTVGALNVYAKVVDAFDAEAVSLAEILAGHAGLAAQIAAALHGHRELAEHMRIAMQSRAAIEQAKGILMGTLGCSADDAFKRLAEQSQHENRKLREVAEELVRRYTSG